MVDRRLERLSSWSSFFSFAILEFPKDTQLGQLGLAWVTFDVDVGGGTLDAIVTQRSGRGMKSSGRRGTVKVIWFFG